MFSFWSMIMLLKYTHNVMVCLFLCLNQNLVQVREYTFLWLFLLLIIFRASCDFICFSQAGTFLVFTLDFLPLNLWVCWKWEKITAWSYKSLNTKYKLRKFRGCWGHAEKKRKNVSHENFFLNLAKLLWLVCSFSLVLQ